MFRFAIAFAAALFLSVAASAENVADRSLEEALVLSPVILTGKVTKAAGEFKADGLTLKKFDVEVADVTRAPENGPTKSTSITVYTAASHKDGEELLFLLGNKGQNGHRVSLALKPSELVKVQKLIDLESRADKELDGKNKLAAAFLHAHKLRPVLLAAAEGKNVKQGTDLVDSEKEKLLAVLSWGLTEAAKKDAPPEVKQLSELLLKVLSGPGGLPDFATRNERITQFWTQRLADEKSRNRYPLARLEVVDRADAAATKVAVAVGQVGMVGIVRGGPIVVAPLPIMPGTEVAPPTPDTPPAVVTRTAGPAEELVGKPVNGLTIDLQADNELYDFGAQPAQPVTITTVFRNTGTTPLRLNTYLLFPKLADIWITDPNGKAATYSAREKLDADRIPAMGPWSFIELSPGAKREFSERIPSARFPRGGDYRLCVAYRNSIGKEFGVTAWTGEVVSQRILIKALRPEPLPEPKPATPTTPKPPDTSPVRPVPRVLPGRAVQIQGAQIQVQVNAANGVVMRRVVVDGKEVVEEAADKEKTPVEKK